MIIHLPPRSDSASVPQQENRFSLYFLIFHFVIYLFLSGIAYHTQMMEDASPFKGRESSLLTYSLPPSHLCAE
jgi:hypothetical protein